LFVGLFYLKHGLLPLRVDFCTRFNNLVGHMIVPRSLSKLAGGALERAVILTLEGTIFISAVIDASVPQARILILATAVTLFQLENNFLRVLT
jgi:hypothetical protein